MKLPFVFLAILLQQACFALDSVRIEFTNDYKDVYHLSLIIYTPDGKVQTRVSNLSPGQVKTYTFPVRSEMYIADRKQEQFAMQGNDIKATGAQPTIVLKKGDKVPIRLSSLKAMKDKLDKKE